MASSQTLTLISAEDLRAIVHDEVQAALASVQPADGFMRVKETAAFLGMSENALRQVIKRSEVPFHRLGERILFDRAELASFVKGGGA